MGINWMNGGHRLLFRSSCSSPDGDWPDTMRVKLAYPQPLSPVWEERLTLKGTG